MRTNTSITKEEQDAYCAFCQQHNILNDQSTKGWRNAEEIGGYIAHTWNENIDQRTLPVALEKLRDRLTFIPAEQVEVAEILSKLDQNQRDIVASWLSRQHRLEVDGPKGFSNVSVLVAWLLNRRYAVTEAGLDMALGNVQNTGKRKIFWKELPRQSREYVQGKPITRSVRRKNRRARTCANESTSMAAKITRTSSKNLETRKEKKSEMSMLGRRS
jgi:hypothetical protein